MVGIVNSKKVKSLFVSQIRYTQSYIHFNVTQKLSFRTIIQWSSQAIVNGVESIFYPHTILPDPYMEDHRFWNMKQVYVMSVLTYTLSAGQ